MDRQTVIEQLRGCFLAVPMQFHPDFPLNLQSMHTIVPSPHSGATRPLPPEFKERLRRLCTEVGMPMERV